MVYIIVIIAIVIIVGYFILKAKSNRPNEFGQALSVMNINTAYYLHKLYKTEYDEEDAMKLSAAVTNQLFGHEAANDSGREYYAQNRDLVERKLGEIPNDKYLCNIVSIAGQIKFGIVALRKQMTPEMIQWIKKLTDMKILLPESEFKFPDTRKDLEKVVLEFHERVKTMS